MTVGNIFEHLPRVLPDGSINVDESHQFTVLSYSNNTTSTKYVYQLDKAPINRIIEVSGSVNGSPYTFSKGIDYHVIDDDNDGSIDSIDFDVGGEQPDDNTDFTVTYGAESIISRYVESHEDVIDVSDAKIDKVFNSHQISNASGDNLDRIGAIFGELGKRRGRTDNIYRSFLRSIVNSFEGRGTVPGLRFAVAAAIGTSEDNITINEDFTQAGYTITIDPSVDTEFIAGAVNDLAQLADPSGVELLSPPVQTLGNTNIGTTSSGTSVTSTSTGLGGGTLTLDGNSTLQ